MALLEENMGVDLLPDFGSAKNIKQKYKKQTKKLTNWLYSKLNMTDCKERNQESGKTAHWMGENICK